MYKEYDQYVKLQTTRRINTYLAVIWLLCVAQGVLDIALWDFAKSVNESASRIDFTKYCLSPVKRIAAVAGTYFFTAIALSIIVIGISAAFFLLSAKEVKEKLGNEG